MEIQFKKIDDNLVVYPIGEIDHHTAVELRTSIDKHYENSYAKNIIIDFKDIGFMDSSGIGMIIGRYKNTSKKGGTVVVANVNDSLSKIFTLSGLGKIIKIYAAVDDALNNI